MTVEELKTEANKLGYNLVKKQTQTKLLRCACGRKPTQNMMWQGQQFVGHIYECRNCSLRSTPHRFKYKAKSNWNEMIEEVS